MSTWPTQYNSYPIPNLVLIKELKMIKHPEGGYFVETDRQAAQVPSPFAGGAPRSLATTIHYLLTPEERNGIFHMNKSATMHVLHQGRAEYTLITPESPPTIERKMGPNIDARELLQLLVPTGIWKMSRLLPEDLVSTSEDESGDEWGCLITEVVFPGFAWEDHAFLTLEEFERLWDGAVPPEAQELSKYVKNS